MTDPMDNIIDKAKLDIMFQPSSTFITSILFSLKLEFSEELPTAGVDGRNLLINPVWFRSLTPKARVGLLAHEAWHVALLHICRGKEYQQTRYNIAADHVINLMLLDNGYELPPKGCHDRQYEGMCTEEVYALLKDMPEPPGYDCDIQAIEGDAKEKEQLQKEMENIVIQASIKSKQENDKAGTIPQDLERMIEALLNPKLPWETILNNLIVEFKGLGDFTWSKPNRRYMPDFYLPSNIDNCVESIAIGIDTSASVSQEEFLAYLSEINSIKTMLNPLKTTVICFDYSLKEINVLGQQDSIQTVEFRGGGGTNIQPIMKWAMKEKPKLLLIFTDGDFDAYEPDLDSQLIWVINNHEEFKSNIGSIIHFEAI